MSIRTVRALKRRESIAALSLAAALLIGCGGSDIESHKITIEQARQAIIGGATDNGDPAIVAIFTHLPNQTSGYLCTGTIISATKVLTAAHCVDPDVIGPGNVHEILLGTTLNGGTLAVSGAAYDPAFDVNNLQAGHDVAVITLAAPTNIAPIPFNTFALTSAATSANTRIAGYGTNNHFGSGSGTKRVATTRINSFDAALLHIGTTSRQTCHGDSGGPALQVINGVERVVGITSYGMDLPIYQCFGGGYSTRVDSYQAFITANL